ncbi:Carbon monoxide dehydrogenase subunit G [Halogranum amylolyticum]|uniref:Carbon monoxide dehydrogenase subunit G n=1 Tax=Halogranum amylolyticum TaxID=660520 RepID=A0A1H8SE91_9EURY|nr:SRPBCC family protein [Halogranum amylolyticum]SEO76664.1 Carbon monoxide dehydrogenase subunit G [Halogranum amylolyticum]
MTVRVQRTFEFDAAPRRVWEFIADPAKRAEAISVVEEYEIDPTDERKATWHIELPIPLLSSTVSVETEDIARDEPRYVKFAGKSRALRVTGEHTIEETENGCKLHNEFVVDGRLPGVEKFFKRNLDRELDNLEDALRRDLGLTA